MGRGIRSESSPTAGRSKTPTGARPKASDSFSKQERPNTPARSVTPPRVISVPSPKASPPSSPKVSNTPRQAAALQDSTKASSTHRSQNINTTSSSKNLRSSPKKGPKITEQTPQPKARSSP